MSLMVSSTDPALDIEDLARRLTDIAFARGLTVMPEPQGVTVTSPCQLATPDEIAAAAGLHVTLKLQDLETACSYEGGKGGKHILIYVAMQDPSTFDGMIAAVGAAPIDGPGDASWWWKDYASLFTRQGDLALQVAITPDKQTPQTKLQQMAIAIMEVLLAP